MERPFDLGDAENTGWKPSNHTTVKHLILAFGFAAVFALGVGTTTASAEKTTFFCQKPGNEPQVVDAGGQGDLTKQGYQCTPVTHEEAFSCTKDGQTIIYFKSPAVPQSQGYECVHIKL